LVFIKNADAWAIEKERMIKEFQFIYRHYAFVKYCSGNLYISISSQEAVPLPEVDAKMREPLSQQFQMLVMHLCAAYLDGPYVELLLS
jgi:hypothetical protein